MPRVAAVQVEASHLDPKAGLERIEELARSAAGDGAEVIVFPELLVPGYPRYVPDPFPHTEEGSAEWQEAVRYHRAYVEGSQVVPGPFTEQLGEIARAVGATLVVGVSERDEKVRGRLWNTGVVIDDQGNYLGKHRKLVAVMHERLIFDRGGVEDIRTFAAPQANIGVCICFENHQPLFRRALGRLGEEIHCALWTGPAPRERAAEGVPLEQHRALGIAHALDTGTFVVIASQVTGVEPAGGEAGPRWSHSGGSYVIDPLGNTLAQVPDWEEGIAIADLDLALIEDARLVWNHLGDDMRDDLFAEFARGRRPVSGAAAGGAKTFRTAAVQAPSVWLDREGSTARACELIAGAGRGGADIVALPESFVPGFPYWLFTMKLAEAAPLHRELHDEAVEIPGPTVEALERAAVEAGVTAVVGVTEREPGRVGTLYNTNVVLGPEGYLGKHRKLVPTWAERVVWAGGDGSTLATFPTPQGPLGTLNCGENVNTLARYALLSEGERVHVATSPPARRSAATTPTQTTSTCRRRRTPTRAGCSTSSPRSSGRRRSARRSVAFDPDAWNCISGTIGPDGSWIDFLKDEAGIVYSDCDPSATVEGRMFHDIAGHYNRFDVLRLQVDRRALGPVANPS